MPARLSDACDSLVPFSPEFREPAVYPVHHGVKPPISRVYISWSLGNVLQVACLRRPLPGTVDSGGGEVDTDEEVGGRLIEVKLGGGEGEISEAHKRKVAYGSVPAFALLQSRKNSLLAASRLSSASIHCEWLQYVLEYSSNITDLLGAQSLPSDSVIDDPKLVVKDNQLVEEPNSLKAAWQLMEIFFVHKHSLSWLPECLVDWLEDYDSLITGSGSTIHSKLVVLQKKLVNLEVIEDYPGYWEGISSALAVGWIETVVKLLRLHGSYQLDQIDNRETENGLVEAVAVLISTMPRMRPDLPNGKIGQCYQSKPDFLKAWEKWREQITKLECSAFWVQCGHQPTREGLRSLLQIMLGNVKKLNAVTCHWVELFVSHFLYIRPFMVGLEGFSSLAQKCRQLKPSSSDNGLMSLLDGILRENPEVVLAECSKTYGPWMLVHAMELLTADSSYADIILHEERYSSGDISIEELHRLVYAQVLSSHPLTLQIAPTYLASCPKQGLGLLEILLYKQPVQHHQLILKNLEICRLYELESIGTNVMKVAGMYNWKHGKKGFGIYWLQQACDIVRLNKIAQQLFDRIGTSVSDDSFKHLEGLIELLGSQVGSSGGLEFLHKYRDFKRSLKQVQEKKASDFARKTLELLIQLIKSHSTPPRFWLPLLHDSVDLLNWKAKPLLSVAETNLLLTKLQELSMAKLHPGFSDTKLSHQTLSSVRLALATNLGRAILEES